MLTPGNKNNFVVRCGPIPECQLPAKRPADAANTNYRYPHRPCLLTDVVPVHLIGQSPIPLASLFLSLNPLKSHSIFRLSPIEGKQLYLYITIERRELKDKRVEDAIMNNLKRNKKFLTKSEYARYLEAMKQHAVDTLAEGI